MLNLLKQLFSVIGELSYKFLNSQSSVLLLIALLLYFISDMMRILGKQLRAGDDNDNSNS